MRRRWGTVYGVVCTLLLAGGLFAVLYFAWKAGLKETAFAAVGLGASCVLTPILHEGGHILFALHNKMRCVYAKFFCFRLQEEGGKLRFSFASPFADDQTQVMPIKSGNMQQRAAAYALGGLAVSGAYALIILLSALVATLFFQTSYGLWGALPYAAYSFLLNAMPTEYASGKTDMLVCLGLRRGEPAERTMLSAMEIHAQLYEGKSFSEVEKSLYFDLPQLPEDEPAYAMILDLRYRYFIEKGEFDGAADALNRLATAQAYLSDAEMEKVAAELVYLHCLNGDIERAEECAKLCKEYLKNEAFSAKRILAAYSALTGKREATCDLLAQAEELLKNEPVEGVQKFERILLSRINTK